MHGNGTVNRLLALRSAHRPNQQFTRTPQPQQSRHQRGSFGFEPSPICSVHGCHMKYVGREWHGVYGRSVPTWACPSRGCTQKTYKPGK